VNEGKQRHLRPSISSSRVCGATARLCSGQDDLPTQKTVVLLQVSLLSYRDASHGSLDPIAAADLGIDVAGGRTVE